MADDERHIRAGLIGYGYAGRTFHAPLIRATAGYSLVAVASSDAAKVQADLPGIAVEQAPAALLRRDDIDLVVIATPNDSHRPLAEMALAAGKHVVVDKPFALSHADAQAVVAAAEAAHRHVAVFQNRRWDSDFLAIRQAIETGRIGAVRHFESHVDRFRPQVRPRWREAAGPGAGLWLDLGPHLVDQALCLFGSPSRVIASFAAQRQGATVEDWAHVVLEYPALRVILHAGMLAAGGSHRFTVHGETGTLLKRAADRQEDQLRAGMIPGAPGWGEDPDDLLLLDGTSPPLSSPAPAGDHRAFYAALREALLGRAPNPVRPDEALAVMAVLDAAARAASTGNAAVPVSGA